MPALYNVAAYSPNLSFDEETYGGWAPIVSGLKTLLETGKPPNAPPMGR